MKKVLLKSFFLTACIAYSLSFKIIPSEYLPIDDLNQDVSMIEVDENFIPNSDVIISEEQVVLEEVDLSVNLQSFYVDIGDTSSGYEKSKNDMDLFISSSGPPRSSDTKNDDNSNYGTNINGDLNESTVNEMPTTETPSVQYSSQMTPEDIEVKKNDETQTINDLSTDEFISAVPIEEVKTQTTTQIPTFEKERYVNGLNTNNVSATELSSDENTSNVTTEGTIVTENEEDPMTGASSEEKYISGMTMEDLNTSTPAQITTVDDDGYVNGLNTDDVLATELPSDEKTLNVITQDTIVTKNEEASKSDASSDEKNISAKPIGGASSPMATQHSALEEGRDVNRLTADVGSTPDIITEKYNPAMATGDPTVEKNEEAFTTEASSAENFFSAVPNADFPTPITKQVTTVEEEKDLNGLTSEFSTTEIPSEAHASNLTQEETRIKMNEKELTDALGVETYTQETTIGDVTTPMSQLVATGVEHSSSTEHTEITSETATEETIYVNKVEETSDFPTKMTAASTDTQSKNTETSTVSSNEKIVHVTPTGRNKHYQEFDVTKGLQSQFMSTSTTTEKPEDLCDQAKCAKTCYNYGYKAGGSGNCDDMGRCLCRRWAESCYFGYIDRCKNEKWWCPGPSSENKCMREPQYSKRHMSCYCKAFQSQTRQD